MGEKEHREVKVGLSGAVAEIRAQGKPGVEKGFS